MSYFTMMGLRTPYDLHLCLKRIVDRYQRESQSLIDTLTHGTANKANYWFASSSVGFMELNAAATEAEKLLAWLDGSEEVTDYFSNEERSMSDQIAAPPVAEKWMLHVVGYAMTYDSYQRVSSRSTSVANNLMEDCTKAFKEQLRSALPSGVVMEYAVAAKKAEEDRIAEWRREREEKDRIAAEEAAQREALKTAARRERRAARKNREIYPEGTR